MGNESAHPTSVELEGECDRITGLLSQLKQRLSARESLEQRSRTSSDAETLAMLAHVNGTLSGVDSTIVAEIENVSKDYVRLEKIHTSHGDHR